MKRDSLRVTKALNVLRSSDSNRNRTEPSPRFDKAPLSRASWPRCASPAVRINLQNYRYGVTAIRFWALCSGKSGGHVPGTLMDVHLGSLGSMAVQGRSVRVGEWALRGVDLLATIALTVSLTRLARRTIKR